MDAALGIDIAKDKFDVVLLQHGQQSHKVFKNHLQGFQRLQAWLLKQGVKQLHACLEATGTYGEGLGEYLQQQGYMISLINPARSKTFGTSRLSRNKTDKVDAHSIALFCQTQSPEPRFGSISRTARTPGICETWLLSVFDTAGEMFLNV